MKSKEAINEKWIKASVIGTIWAASEIVLGSFLHNLKIPFSGNILTAIGIVILIPVSYKWKEKGLFWRAGLICAIMKTMSPSAVIFGPMIAIFSEAMLLEISVRAFGKSITGYLIGASLAMSWNLFQKLANLVIFYGLNIVELYRNLIQYAQKQLNIEADIFWSPILVLLVIYCLLGMASAILGIRVGRKILKQTPEQSLISFSNSFSQNKKTKQEFDYSLVWLFINIMLIVSGFIVLNTLNWIIWSISITIIVLIWLLRYKRALRQLSKPKFWIYFVLITMISAFVFTKIQSESLEKGLLAGFQMNFRAVLVIIGFSVLGTELYNPRIRDFFLKTSFKQLPLALELSFESLPSMISSMPDFKTIAKNPVSIIYQIISQVDFRLAELKSKPIFKPKVFIITGLTGQGKTTFLQKIIENLKLNNCKISGIYSPKVLVKNEITGYDIVDIQTDEREILLRITENESLRGIGRFKISDTGLNKGKNALSTANRSKSQVVVIDEVGNLELNDNGWAENIEELIKTADNHIIMVIRESLVEKVVAKWNIKPELIFNIAENDYTKVSASIIEHIS